MAIILLETVMVSRMRYAVEADDMQEAMNIFKERKDDMDPFAFNTYTEDIISGMQVTEEEVKQINQAVGHAPNRDPIFRKEIEELVAGEQCPLCKLSLDVMKGVACYDPKCPTESKVAVNDLPDSQTTAT